MNKIFERKDKVVVVGATLNKDGSKTDYRFEICEVVEVAKYDLIVSSNTSFKRPFRVAKNNCFRVDLAQVKTHNKQRGPKIGDLVLYFHSGYDKTEKQVGILMNIIDNPGSSTVARIMHGPKVTEVPYKDVMILEENNCKKPESAVK